MMLRQIQHFQTIVQENSFTEAAELCHISQSGISQSIKALEDEIAAAQALAAAHPEATEQALAELLAAIEAAVDALDAAVSAESLAKALASLKGAEANFLNTAVGIVSVESAVKAGNVFNLKGQKVQQTNKKGLYVVNGKKVVK